MPSSTVRVTVGTASAPAGTLAAALATDDNNRGPGAERVTVFNYGTVDIYVGYSTAVLTTTGCPVPAGRSIDFPLERGEALFAIAGSSTSTVQIIRGLDFTKAL